MKETKLKILQDNYSNCNKCELSKKRNKIVFGKGNIDSKILFLAEAPGASEDEMGLPFVGRAGKMLDKMIEAMALKTEDVYICNTVMCRPPDNRKPTPEEMTACASRLVQQIETINPKIIVALGASAAEALLGVGPSVTKRRGSVHSWKNFPVVVTFHPSYLLRNPPAKDSVKEDLKIVLDFLKEKGNE